MHHILLNFRVHTHTVLDSNICVFVVCVLILFFACAFLNPRFRWNAGIEFIDGEPALFYLGERVPLNLIPVAAVHFPLIALAELLRDGKLQIPGLKGLDRMYPGGPAFDPLGLAKKTGDDAQELKTLELAGSRVAMVSVFVFVIEAVFLRRGPVEALLY